MSTHILRIGITNQTGLNRASQQDVNGVIFGNTVSWTVNFPVTNEINKNWFFQLPSGATLQQIESFGQNVPFSNDRDLDDTPLWIQTSLAGLYIAYYGIAGSRYRATITARIAPAVSPGQPITSQATAFEESRPNVEDIFVTVAYPEVTLTPDVRRDVLGQIQDALRVESSTDLDAYLWRLFLTSISQIEHYFQHAMVQRSFNSVIYFPKQNPPPERYIVRVAGVWATVSSVTGVTANDVTVQSPPIKRHLLQAQPETNYNITSTLGPYDGPYDGSIGLDVMEAIIRLVGWRYDSGIYQSHALVKSGALELLARYENRDAVLL